MINHESGITKNGYRCFGCHKEFEYIFELPGCYLLSSDSNIIMQYFCLNRKVWTKRISKEADKSAFFICSEECFRYYVDWLYKKKGGEYESEACGTMANDENSF